MSKSRTIGSEGGRKWTLRPFFRWARSKVRAFISLFSEEVGNYPQDESGKLMERIMARQSWFDSLSSQWVQQRFLSKIGYISGITLLAGVVGLGVGAALLFSLSAIFISILSHTLLISHEKHRRQSANIFAEESEELNKSLTRSQGAMEGIRAEMYSISDALKRHSEGQAAQIVALDFETKKVQQSSEELSLLMGNGQVSARLLLEKESALHSEMDATSRHLTQYIDRLAQSIAVVSEIAETTAQFSEVMRDIQCSKEKFGQATNSFALFAGGFGLVAHPAGHVIESDNFMASMDEATAVLKMESTAIQLGVFALSAQNAEFDIIREQWGIHSIVTSLPN